MRPLSNLARRAPGPGLKTIAAISSTDTFVRLYVTCNTIIYAQAGWGRELTDKSRLVLIELLLLAVLSSGDGPTTHCSLHSFC